MATAGSGGADVTPPPPGFDPTNPGPIGFGTPDGAQFTSLAWATVPTIGGAASLDVTADGGATVVLPLATYRCRNIIFFGTPGVNLTVVLPAIATGSYAEWILQNESNASITVQPPGGATTVVLAPGDRKLVVINAQHYATPGHIFIIS